MIDKQLFENTSIAFANKSAKELKKMNFLFFLMGIPELTKVGTFFIKTLLKLNFPVKKIIRKTLFKQFCGGENLGECQVVVKQLFNSNIKTILDYSAEGESTEEYYVKNMEMVLKTIEMAAKDKCIGFAVFKISGLGSTMLLEKLQKDKQSLSKEEFDAIERIEYRVHRLCEAAFLAKVKILIDAEESWIQGSIDSIAVSMMKKFNKEKALVYSTIQLYRKDAYDNLIRLSELARRDFFIPAVKLVRGAYMEKERMRAKALGYEVPIQPTKEATDLAYDNALLFCVEKSIPLCAGTHNEGSTLYLIELMRKFEVVASDEKIYFAQLYGMSDHISYNLGYLGYNVVKYLPFGPVHLVMPYLFRRAEENVSVTGQTGRELRLIRSEIKRRKSVNGN